MRNKKLMAAVMAAAMTLALAVPAFAADATTGSATAAGSNTGHPDPNKVVVVLPTVAKNSLDYIVDPQRLIEATSAEAYGSGVSFDASANTASSIASRTLYFKTGKTTYTNASPALEITSKTFNPLSAFVYATVADNDAIRLATDSSGEANWTADATYVDAKGNVTTKKPLIYLKMQQVGEPDADSGVAAIPNSANEVAIENFGLNMLEVKIASNGTLVSKYDSKTKGYYYGTDDADFSYAKGYFNLTGIASPMNTNAGATAGTVSSAGIAAWSEVTSSTKVPTVSLTWSVVPTSEDTHVVSAQQEKSWHSETGSVTYQDTAIALDRGGGNASVTKVAISTTGFGMGESTTECNTIANAKKVGFTEDGSNAGQIDYSAGLTVPDSTFSKLKSGQAVFVRIFWDDDTISNVVIKDDYTPVPAS